MHCPSMRDHQSLISACSWGFPESWPPHLQERAQRFAASFEEALCKLGAGNPPSVTCPQLCHLRLGKAIAMLWARIYMVPAMGHLLFLLAPAAVKLLCHLNPGSLSCGVVSGSQVLSPAAWWAEIGSGAVCQGCLSPGGGLSGPLQGRQG
jgi:hypothetical protein